VPSTIAIVGTGYVGLTTGVGLAHLGHTVICADVDADKINELRAGRIPIREAGLPELLSDALADQRLSFVLGSEHAVAEADIVFLCLPTPQATNGEPEMGYVLAAAETIGPLLRPGTIVVNKSTVPIGASQMVATALGRADVSVVSNPEFLREGTAVSDFLNPQRIIVGGDDPIANQRVADLYQAFTCPVLMTDAASAEACKYASNAFLAMKLSFVNTMAAICESYGADIDAVTAGMGHDARIGPDFLQPGPGWGGSCFPKDTQALISLANQQGIDFALLRAAVDANQQQFDRVTDKVGSVVDLAGATVAVLGLTFKAGTDDTRDSPALEIVKRLTARGATVRAHDPALTTAPNGIELHDDVFAAAQGCDAVVIATEWPEYAKLDLSRLAEVVNQRHLIDTRNLLARSDAEQHGFTYQNIGRP
jgi:UDPglucose 6-dehydrogenase